MANKDAVKIELDDLPTVLGLYDVEHKTKIDETNQISTITEIFNEMSSAKEQCSEIHKHIMLYFASASGERTFSCMTYVQ